MKRVRVLGGVAAVQEPGVEAEDRDDVTALLERGTQRGMVVHAEVAGEPEQCRHAAGH